MSFIIPEVPLTLDRPRHLRLDLAALATAQRYLKEELETPLLMTDLIKQAMALEPDVVSAVLWAGLRHEDPSLTWADVHAMLHLGHMTLVVRALSRCLAEDDAAQDPQAPANGATSGRTPAMTSD